MTYFQPLTAIVVALGLLALLQARDRRSRLAIAAAVVGLLTISWPPLEWIFSRPLESRYSKRAVPSRPVDAIVVLSAGMKPPKHGLPYSIPDRDTYERCQYAAWLFKQWRRLPVLACGGSADAQQRPYSTTMRDIVEGEGVPAEMIWTEERSRSTHENAVYGAEILRAHGIKTIALVVEARSMPRAEACFRREGIQVIAAPSSFGPEPDEFQDWLPNWRAIARNETTLHEAVGIGWYWLRGWL